LLPRPPRNRSKQAELAAAQALGNTEVDVPLPDGAVLQVALGQERCANPADGREYSIKWAQDDAGHLVVLDVLPLGPAQTSSAGAGGPGGGAAARPSGAGVRRRGRSGTGLLRRSHSISRLLASGIDLLLGSKSQPASVDSDSLGDSSSGGALSAAPSGSQRGGGAARARSSSGGGAAAAELGERGFRLSAPTGLFGLRSGPHLRQQ
jgi:hypothetical protein